MSHEEQVAGGGQVAGDRDREVKQVGEEQMVGGGRQNEDQVAGGDGQDEEGGRDRGDCFDPNDRSFTNWRVWIILGVSFFLLLAFFISLIFIAHLTKKPAHPYLQIQTVNDLTIVGTKVSLIANFSPVSRSHSAKFNFVRGQCWLAFESYSGIIKTRVRDSVLKHSTADPWSLRLYVDVISPEYAQVLSEIVEEKGLVPLTLMYRARVEWKKGLARGHYHIGFQCPFVLDLGDWGAVDAFTANDAGIFYLNMVCV